MGDDNLNAKRQRKKHTWNSFINTHSLKASDDRSKMTHTSMRGGVYCITDEEEEEFLELYHRHVIEGGVHAFITEKQRDPGPIVIDLDFRYDGIVERRHTRSHIIDFIDICVNALSEMIDLHKDNDTPMNIYIMEKQKTNPLPDKNITKDGIHILFGIQMSHQYQLYLRKKILEHMPDVFDDLGLINTYDQVFDEGLSTGKTNWTLYGSRKVDHDPYTLTIKGQIDIKTNDNDNTDFRYMTAKFDTDDNFSINDWNALRLLTVRYTKWWEPNILAAVINECETAANNLTRRTDNAAAKMRRNTSFHNGAGSFFNIQCGEDLQATLDEFLESLTPAEHHIRETHEYTQILPEKYYEPGSHDLNRKVAFALKHTDDRLFLSWVALRSKASDFDYNSIDELHDRWKRYFNVRDDRPCLTRKSIVFWAKEGAPEDYERVRLHMIDHYVQASFKSSTDYDFALVLYQLYRDKYVCNSINTKNNWYVFNKHRWELDRGKTLRQLISEDMYAIYQKYVDEMTDRVLSFNAMGTENEHNDLKKQLTSMINVSNRLRQRTSKDSIMIEAQELFFDGEFSKKMDQNIYLLCFTNGVVDLKNKLFRDGKPEDYITKCTNIPYYPLDTLQDNPMLPVIHAFMDSLFPIVSLRKYMYDHLAACLIGDNKEQVFIIYRGSGCNGKTVLTELMARTLGEYKGLLPVNYVTDKRHKIGSSSSEIMKLKGARYVVMEEVTKDMRLNEGVMKDVTGGAPMQGRELYHEAEEFIPQFNLVVCTNNLFEVNSNDDGTWRRIKIVDFMSKFCGEEDIEKNKKRHPYVFVRDKSLIDKLNDMAPVFASILVNRAFETEGVVLDCQEVTAASDEYRRKQDVINAFITTKIDIGEGDEFIAGTREVHESFKLWFRDERGTEKCPKLSELDDELDLRFGKRNFKKRLWKGFRVIYETEDNTQT